jgi:NAD(P)-dependent dehydrogenase (short-subunit alcohol dehydrogenase family)
VVTGGGSGMGRELVRQLVAEGCAVAMCDVSARGMAETQRLCEAGGLPQGLRVTAHAADVSNEPDVQRFRNEMAAHHATDRIHRLFNNAGISGGGSMIINERAEWERTFNICWRGVYLTTLAFQPMLWAADEAHIVNAAALAELEKRDRTGRAGRNVRGRCGRSGSGGGDDREGVRVVRDDRCVGQYRGRRRANRSVRNRSD